MLRLSHCHHWQPIPVIIFPRKYFPSNARTDSRYNFADVIQPLREEQDCPSTTTNTEFYCGTFYGLNQYRHTRKAGKGKGPSHVYAWTRGIHSLPPPLALSLSCFFLGVFFVDAYFINVIYQRTNSTPHALQQRRETSEDGLNSQTRNISQWPGTHQQTHISKTDRTVLQEVNSNYTN